MSLSSLRSIFADCPPAPVPMPEHLVAHRTRRRHGAVMAFSGRLALVIASLPLAGCQSGSLGIPHGLHNSSKAFTAAADMRRSDWSDPAEMERAWQAALVRIPEPDGGFLSTTIAALGQGGSQPRGVWPTVIYMHGCSGIWPGTLTRINFLARNGYAVIAPASFARLKYPRSCRPETHEGGLYRPILGMRQHDAGHAIASAKGLPWVDSGNVFLMGLSEGGITTATFARYNSPPHAVQARVVEGWTCQSGWPEQAGINAPRTEPVLTLVGARDPWFQNPWNQGSCRPFLDGSNGSRSVVYDTGYLQSRHELLEDAGVQRTVLEFLRQHTSRPPG